MTALSRARILEAIALLEKVLQEDEPVGLEAGGALKESLARLKKSDQPYSFPGAPAGAAGGNGIFGLETVRWHRKL